MPHIWRFALVDEGGIARDDEEAADARKSGRDVLDHAVGEILLFGIAAHIREGQDSDRRLVGERKRPPLLGWPPTASLWPADHHTIGTHSPRDVLQRLLTHVLGLK